MDLSHFFPSLNTSNLLDNGNVLLAGGYSGVNYASTYSSAEIYNSTTGVVSNTGSMISQRGDFAMVKLNNGKILVTGGFIGTNFSNFQHLRCAGFYIEVWTRRSF